eukprot:scaffold142168_cov136-Phaeocystis_antarctica.AAC.1
MRDNAIPLLALLFQDRYGACTPVFVQTTIVPRAHDGELPGGVGGVRERSSDDASAGQAFLIERAGEGQAKSS